jgi:hypothetical protein
MNQQKISYREMLKFGFNKLIDNIIFWIGLILAEIFLLVGAIGIIGGIGTALLKILHFPYNLLLSTSFFMGSAYVASMVIAGIIQVCLDFYDTGSSRISRLWKPTSYTIPINLLVAALLFSIMVGIGLLFFIIPGIYLATKFWFFAQIIVDKKAGPLEAFQESARITQLRMQEIFILIILITLTGCIPLVGFILAMLCNCYVYRQLSPKNSVL